MPLIGATRVVAAVECIVGWMVIGVIAVVLLVDLAIRLPLARFILPIFEHAPPFNAEMAPPVPDAELISIEMPDATIVRGAWHHQKLQPPRGVIVFCSEFGGNHWTARSYCEGLWKAGFDIIGFDFRGQGESDHIPGYKPLHWLSNHNVEDVLAVLRFVRSRDELKGVPVGLFGVSRGGGAALAAASLDAQVVCVACDGAFSTNSVMLHYARRWASLVIAQHIMDLIPDWHVMLTLRIASWTSQRRRGCRYVNIERRLSRLSNRPILLISGEQDAYVLPQMAKQLAERIDGTQCEVWLVPDAKHNLARSANPAAYDAKLVSFYSNACDRLDRVTRSKNAAVG